MRRQRDARRARGAAGAGRAGARGLDPLGAPGVPRRRPRRLPDRDRRDRRHRHQHPRVRGRRAPGDAGQRRRRAAAVQLHPAGDRPHRAAGGGDLDRGRLAGARQADEARDRASCSASPTRTLAVLLNDARGWAKATLPTYQDRKEFFESIVNGDPDPIELLRAGDDATAVRDADRVGPARPARRRDERAHPPRRRRARAHGRRRR